MVEVFVVTSLISMTLFAYTNILSKILVDRTGGAIQWLLVHLTVELPLLVGAYFLYYGVGMQTTELESLVYIIISSIFTFLGYLFLLLGFREGNASVGGVILSIRVIFSIPLAYLFIGESYGKITYFSLIFAVIGGVIVSYYPGMKIKDLILLRSEGMKFYLATTFSWSISNFFVRKLANGDSIDSVLFYLAARQVIMFCLGIITYYIVWKKFSAKKIIINSTNRLGIFVYGITAACAQFLFVFALGKNLTITEGIGVLEGGFTFIYSVLIARFVSNEILDEPLDRTIGMIRFFGILLSTFGTLLAIITST